MSRGVHCRAGKGMGVVELKLSDYVGSVQRLAWVRPILVAPKLAYLALAP